MLKLATCYIWGIFKVQGYELLKLATCYIWAIFESPGLWNVESSHLWLLSYFLLTSATHVEFRYYIPIDGRENMDSCLFSMASLWNEHTLSPPMFELNSPIPFFELLTFTPPAPPTLECSLGRKNVWVLIKQNDHFLGLCERY